MRLGLLLRFTCLAVLGSIPALAASAGSWGRLPELPHAADDLSDRPRARVLVRGLRLGQIHIAFEETRWTALQRRLGPFWIRHQGDGGEAEDWTCFTLAQPSGPYRVWLDGGELDGGESISGVTARSGASWPVRECPLVNPGRGTVALDNGLWLGASKSEVTHRLGRPTAAHGRILIYDFDVPVRDRRGEGAVTGRLIFTFRADRVDSLMASKTTSY